MHIPRKALNLLLEAVAVPTEMDIEIHVLGDGPCNGKWKKLAYRLGINSKIRWYGWIEKEEAVKVMGKTHFLCVTSLFDGVSSVVLEALSVGLPVVCLDLYGFGEVVDETCGIKIPASTPADITLRFSGAIKKIYDDENLRQKLSKGALAKSAEFLWERKAQKISEIYHFLCEQGNWGKR